MNNNTKHTPTPVSHGSLEYHLGDMIALIKYHMPGVEFAAVKQAEAALKSSRPTLRDAINEYREARAAFKAAQVRS